MDSKLKFAAGTVALSVPVFALYLGLAAPGPATKLLPALPAGWLMIAAGLGSFLLGWVAIATWGFADSAARPDAGARRSPASAPAHLGRLSWDARWN